MFKVQIDIESVLVRITIKGLVRFLVFVGICNKPFKM